MKSLAFTLTIILSPALAVYAYSHNSLEKETASWPEQLSYEIPLRMLQMPAPFAIEYCEESRRQLTDYLRQGKRETERMLARTALYFPIFEYYLQKYNLPDELKYIPLLESRLRPAAQSTVGAAGLWQFMLATAEYYRLEIDEYVDERLSPYQATEAAVKMLADLYKDFGEWSLVLAAYNCGPGRVRSAVRQTGCHNFWDIQHLLPRQTQRYLPALAATIYVARYHQLHGLRPNPKKPLFQPFRVFKVQHALDLSDIARHCSVSRQLLARLNPGFLQDYIPHSSRGRYLILPEEALASFQKYIIKESRKATKSYAIAVLDSHQPLPSSNAPTDEGINERKADI